MLRDGTAFPDRTGDLQSHNLAANSAFQRLSRGRLENRSAFGAHAPYAIGGEPWAGLSKLIEEMGEVGQVVGKILGAGGDVSHWDGGPPLDERLEDELADLLAAIAFVAETNGLQLARIRERTERKKALFEKWHAGPGATFTDSGE